MVSGGVDVDICALASAPTALSPWTGVIVDVVASCSCAGGAYVVAWSTIGAFPRRLYVGGDNRHATSWWFVFGIRPLHSSVLAFSPLFQSIISASLHLSSLFWFGGPCRCVILYPGRMTRGSGGDLQRDACVVVGARACGDFISEAGGVVGCPRGTYLIAKSTSNIMAFFGAGRSLSHPVPSSPVPGPCPFHAL